MRHSHVRASSRSACNAPQTNKFLKPIHRNRQIHSEPEVFTGDTPSHLRPSGSPNILHTVHANIIFQCYANFETEVATLAFNVGVSVPVRIIFPFSAIFLVPNKRIRYANSAIPSSFRYG